jgi:hypothetical protein
MFVVVFHACYYGMADSGCRVYSSDDQYLSDHPSMYSELARFESEADAQLFCSEQPVDEVALAEYWDRE